jgi:hypothetical protein
MDARKPTILYPLNTSYGVVAAVPSQERTQEVSLQVQYRDVVQQVDLLNTSADHVLVTPEGYYLQQEEIEDRRVIAIASCLLNGEIKRIPKFTLDDFLDPASLTMLFRRNNEVVVCALNQTHSNIFAYTLLEPVKDGYGLRLISHAAGQNTEGFCMHSAAADDKRKITNIAAFSHEDQCSLIVGYDTGEMTLYSVNAKLEMNVVTKLQGVSADYQNMSMMVTATGLLVVHSINAGKLKVWDMRDISECTEHNVPRLGRLTASTDGHYLIAKDNSHVPDDSLVHVFYLKPFVHHEIRLKEPVDGLVIGKDDNVFAALRGLPVEVASARYIGKITSLIALKHEPRPLDPEKNMTVREQRSRMSWNQRVSASVSGKFGRAKGMIMPQRRGQHKDEAADKSPKLK